MKNKGDQLIKATKDMHFRTEPPHFPGAGGGGERGTGPLPSQQLWGAGLWIMKQNIQRSSSGGSYGGGQGGGLRCSSEGGGRN